MTARFMLRYLVLVLLTTKANAVSFDFGSASDAESQQHKGLRSHSWSWSWPWIDNTNPTTTTSYWTTLDHRNQHEFEYYFYEWPDRTHTTYSPTATPTFDSTSYVPTLDHSEDSPFHYSNYRKNSSRNQHEHDYYFYEWPDRSHSTYSPTATATSNVVSTEAQATTLPQPPTRPLASPIQSLTYNDQNVLFSEHFLDGFGVFLNQGSPNTCHYPSSLGRQGVVELKRSSTLSSYDIAINESSPQMIIIFAFHAECIDSREGFCLEYSVNDDTDWNPVRCWQNSVDFEINRWNDDFIAILNLDDSRIQVESIRIRFETIASGDDASIKFDRISLLRK